MESLHNNEAAVMPISSKVVKFHDVTSPDPDTHVSACFGSISLIGHVLYLQESQIVYLLLASIQSHPVTYNSAS